MVKGIIVNGGQDNMKEVYIVLVANCDGSDIIGVYNSYNKAYNIWNEQRLKIIENTRRIFEFNRKMYGYYDDNIKYIKSIEEEKEALQFLNCTNPDLIDNGPHDTPLLKKYKVK